ncbi:hypothetical protein O181_093548 [Austropuccinia psidii MF-1]|uniref:Uncharacterized protein n=1 Tax=Austropuccinia psidii MF-1 TaxID=1389203 RepID=A0A9Q3P9F1_9BASI|nr:hypothetical protein [Austropuccinia psidii MF-1]
MSRQRQDNVNCHMRMSLKAQTHFNTIGNVQVISPHWLPPPQRLACFRARTALQMRLRHCPPISVLTTPYAFTPPPLPFLRSKSALPTPLILTLAECPPNMLLTLLTILMLAECPPNMLPTPLIFKLPYYIHSVRWLVGVHDEHNL